MKMPTLALLAMLAASGPSAAGVPTPTSFDAAAAWTRFLAEGKFRETNDAYQVLERVGYDGRNVRPEGCREHAVALEEAVRAVPVGLAVRHARMLCADSTGDAARADAELGVVGALVRDGLARTGDGAWPRPIRVVRPEDVDAFIAAGGYERRFAYYGFVRPARYFPLTVSARDPERGVERLFDFDYVDTLVQLAGDGELHGFPVDRFSTAVAFVDAWAGGGTIAAVDARAVREAWGKDDVREKRDLLKAAVVP